MSISNFFEDALLDALNGNDPSVAGVWIKLHTGDPGEAGTSNAAAETDRQAVVFNAPSGGTMTNDGDVDWTGVSNSETYSHISLWDHATAGNCLWVGALTSPVAVTASDDFSILDEDLTLTLG